MATRIILLLSIVVQLVSAHFQINYPSWRANSFLTPYSQYLYPCAGVVEGTEGINRTTWPLDGGSLNIDFHHPFTYVFINLGLGSNVTNFNISLTAMPLNETGNGTLCIEKFPIPTNLGITDGTPASIQIATVGPEGTALYNCADIEFSSNASLLASDQCSNSTGVSWSVLKQEFNGATEVSPSNSSNSTTAAKSAASEYSTLNKWAVTALVGLAAVVVAFGL